jgi:hypothetical protein
MRAKLGFASTARPSVFEHDDAVDGLLEQDPAPGGFVGLRQLDAVDLGDVREEPVPQRAAVGFVPRLRVPADPDRAADRMLHPERMPPRRERRGRCLDGRHECGQVVGVDARQDRPDVVADGFRRDAADLLEARADVGHAHRAVRPAPEAVDHARHRPREILELLLQADALAQHLLGLARERDVPRDAEHADQFADAPKTGGLEGLEQDAATVRSEGDPFLVDADIARGDREPVVLAEAVGQLGVDEVMVGVADDVRLLRTEESLEGRIAGEVDARRDPSPDDVRDRVDQRAQARALRLELRLGALLLGAIATDREIAAVGKSLRRDVDRGAGAIGAADGPFAHREGRCHRVGRMRNLIGQEVGHLFRQRIDVVVSGEPGCREVREEQADPARPRSRSRRRPGPSRRGSRPRLPRACWRTAAAAASAAARSPGRTARP